MRTMASLDKTRQLCRQVPEGFLTYWIAGMPASRQLVVEMQLKPPANMQLNILQMTLHT